MLYGKLNYDSILFIGFNPSFSDENHERIQNLFANCSARYIKSIHQYDPHKIPIPEIIKIQSKARESIDYFKKMREVADYVSLLWEHVDLFSYRETTQAKPKGEFWHGKDFNAYYSDQMKLSLALVFELRPKLIMVTNAGASTILRGYLKDRLRFESKLGTYTVALKSKRVPIFFSSMLSGQRALDKGSFERLKWHAQHALRLA